MKVNVYKQSGKVIRDTRIRSFVRHIAAAEHYSVPILNIVFADREYLRKLNEEFFGERRSTNVISFNMGSCAEIYISEEKAPDVFSRYYFITHGLLHIIGYDHAAHKDRQIMERKCHRYVEQYCEGGSV